MEIHIKNTNQPRKLRQNVMGLEPEQLLASCRNVMRNAVSKPSKLPPVTLYESKGQFDSFSPEGAQASVLYLWSKNTAELAADAPLLSNAARQLGTRARFADVLLDADTSTWSALRKQHLAAWTQHFWAPEGPVNSELKRLNIVASTIVAA